MPSISVRSRVQLTLLALASVFLPSLTSSCTNSRERPLQPRSQTWAELRTVRRAVKVKPPSEAERAPYPRERLVDGEVIKVDAEGLAWLRRDGGATLLVKGPAELTLRSDAIEITEGRVFVDTPTGPVTELDTPSGPLFLSHVRASIDVSSATKSSEAYVLSGEIRTRSAAHAAAGEKLVLRGEDGAEGAEVTPALTWEDWTGGLATTDRAPEPSPYGVGTVGARKPGEQGSPRFPLAIQRLDVKVTIDRDFAITEVDELFFNPSSDTVEGVYRFRTPEGATLHRFGVDRDGVVVWGRVKEKQSAAAQYQANVYEGSREDPALLEWDAPGVYRARLYPIGPGDTRRVVVRYAEWLGRSGPKGERRLYVYPMAAEGAERTVPHIEELYASIDLGRSGAKEVRVGMAGTRTDDTIIVRGHDLLPRADLALELFDEGIGEPRAVVAPHEPDLETLPPNERKEATERARNEADYLLVPIRATDVPEPEHGLDLAIVVDTSAATESSSLAVARASTAALLAHLGKDDRAAVWAGDTALRPIDVAALSGEAEIRKAMLPVDEARRRALLASLARVERGGATDLGAMLTQAASALDPARRSVIVYIGDSSPTVGELDLGALKARLAKLPRPVRIFGLGIGDDADMAMLEGLSHGAFAERIGDTSQAARAALRLFELAERPAWLGASIDLGPSVERVFPRDLGAMVADESALLIGRLTGATRPTSITIQGTGEPKTLRIAVSPLNDRGDLRRRWAEARLGQMMNESTGRAAMVDLGVRHGIITPYTSLYVPTKNEMTSQERAELERRRLALHGGRFVRATDASRRELSAAAEREMEEKETEQIAEASADNKEGGTGTRAKGEEGSMGNPNAHRSSNRYGVRGPAAPPKADMELAPPPPAPDKELTPSPHATAMPADPFIARQQALRDAAEFGMIGILEPSAGGEPAPEPPTSGGDGWGKGHAGGGKNTGVAGATATTTVDLPKATDAMPRPTDPSTPPSDEATGKLKAKSDAFEARPDFGGTSVVVRVDDVPHVAIHCSGAALLPLGERIGLWRERLARVGGNAHAVANVYRRALSACEAPTWRERSKLLSMLIDAMPTVTGRVALWRVLFKDLGAADTIYRGILARVRTPAEVRELHDALGLKSIDPSILQKTLKDAKTPEERVKKLRSLVRVWPDDFTLALTLLDALEDAGDTPSARELARELRARPDADARVRTAVGELYLRLAASVSSPEEKAEAEGEARRAFGEIVEFAPDDPVARRRLGDLFRAHGWYDAAARQYETLARLAPDDASVALLLAGAAEGLGKLEEAIKWTEKGGSAFAPATAGDAADSPARLARAIAATYLAWGRLAALEAGRKDEAERIALRLGRVVSTERTQNGALSGTRVTLTWAHPELHPTLWSNALGAPMPAPDGDPSLGIAQVIVPRRGDAFVEVRLDRIDVEHAARLGAKAWITAVFGEGTETERIVKMPVTFTRTGAAVRRFALQGNELREVVP